jgi:tetratricopeptide (TPR) repeat protein
VLFLLILLLWEKQMLFKTLKVQFMLTAILLIFSQNLFAESLENFYKLFRSAEYPLALESLANIPVENLNLATKAYLSGLCYSKMQEYDKAASNFSKAIDLKIESEDVFFEQGQALYASNELRSAQSAFKNSADRKFNRSASLYYVAHIAQILEEYEVAREYYTLVLKEKNLDLKMKQIANYQLAETLLSIARIKSKLSTDLVRRVEKFIIPLMQKAFDLDKSSSLSADINQKISELMKEFSLDPNMLANGRRISPDRFAGYVSQKIKFDDNITSTNEENNITQSRKESFLFETELNAKYDFVINKRFIVSPEIRLTYLEHSDQASSEVYTNDSFVSNYSLKNKYEHKINEKPARFIFDIDFSKTMKDYQAIKKREAYSSSITLTFGESFSFFEVGDSTLKYKVKKFTGTSTTINNNTNSFSVDQTVILPNQHLLIALFDVSYVDNYNNNTTNTDAYLFRIDYIISEILPQISLGFGLSYTLTDTLTQETTRGLETSLNPSLNLSKEVTQNSKISINFDHTKTKSKSTAYVYSKNVIASEYRYSF